MNAIATTAMPMQDLQILADAIARSNLFGIKTKEQALVLMMIARSEGRDPVEAARDYDIIQGKPAKKAEAMLRDFLVAGGKVEWHELSDIKADATFTHPQTGSVRIDWDLARANTAGFGGKDMWKKFPRQMLRSRVVSEGVRTLWPLATSGFYVPEEQADIAPHNGPTIEAEPDAREALNAGIPLKAAAASTPRPPRVTEKQAAAYETEAEKPARTPRQFLMTMEIALRDAQSVEDVHRILEGEQVLRAKETFGPDAKKVLLDLEATAIKRWFHEPPDDELSEVQIAGEERLAAG